MFWCWEKLELLGNHPAVQQSVGTTEFCQRRYDISSRPLNLVNRFCWLKCIFIVGLVDKTTVYSLLLYDIILVVYNRDVTLVQTEVVQKCEDVRLDVIIKL